MADHSDVSATDYKDKMEHNRYGRSSHSRRRTLKIILLSMALAVTALVLLVVSIYSIVKISALNESNRNLQTDLEQSQRELDGLKPQLEKANQEMAELIKGRFPNLEELVFNKVLRVNNRHVKNVVFNIIKQANQQQYKYLLVVENNTPVKIQPAFRVLLFDEYGVHVATDEVKDMNELNPGESRDYASDIEFFFDTTPKHFYIDDFTEKSDGG
ncbi:MAG: hypothetical protein K9K86_06155 [Pseudomonadales bacterium]|nr:hypothetical protein [Pseudomonadales bacterium]